VNGNSERSFAGDFDDADGKTHGFIDVNGSYKRVDKPGAPYSSVNGIANSGVLAGTAGTLPTDLHAFSYAKGAFGSAEPPNSARSYGGAVNDRGDIVGMSVSKDAPNKRSGFVLSAGRFTAINVPKDHPVSGTGAWGINNKGDIIGSYVDADSNRHGFLLRGGRYTALDVPGAFLTVGQGINDAGVIVGLYLDAAFVSHGFVKDRGVYNTVDAPNSVATAIYTINDDGVIGGTYDAADGKTYGFLAAPKH
jgi:uncharacterized membrane protein